MSDGDIIKWSQTLSDASQFITWARDDLRGCHPKYSLCNNCEKYNHNCGKARRIEDLRRLDGIVAPVFECPDWKFTATIKEY